ncbi:MAG TPA: transmembrane family-2 glycosyl transferase, partial [Salinimicrobium sp.]|nr:transmembrane family-2 glycosyl transferase [Salinimicrobium sp.]
DIFLLEKFQTAGLKTTFLKNANAIVITNSQPHLKALFMQRIRWAAKASAYAGFFPKAIGISVFLVNLLIVAGLIFLAAGFEVKRYLFLTFLVKFNLDFVLIYRSAQFFGRESSMKNYFWASVVYPFFCCIVVFFSGFAGYHWKGRNFRK